MRHTVSSPNVIGFFRRYAFVFVVALVSGGAVFLVQRGRADSLPGIMAFQAADMGSRAVLEEMKSIGKGAISRLSGGCNNGSIKGKNSSGTYQITFRDIADRQMSCSENLEDVAAIETTGFFAPEKRIVRATLVQTASAESNDYVTTGTESQVKKGALGIGGLLKAYLGINANSQRITNVAAPTESSDAATKAYVDAAGGGGSSGGGISGGCDVQKVDWLNSYYGCGQGKPCGCLKTENHSVKTVVAGQGCKEYNETADSELTADYSCASVSKSGYSCIEMYSKTNESTSEGCGMKSYSKKNTWGCLCWKN